MKRFSCPLIVYDLQKDLSTGGINLLGDAGGGVVPAEIGPPEVDSSDSLDPSAWISCFSRCDLKFKLSTAETLLTGLAAAGPGAAEDNR